MRSYATYLVTEQQNHWVNNNKIYHTSRLDKCMFYKWYTTEFTFYINLQLEYCLRLALL